MNGAKTSSLVCFNGNLHSLELWYKSQGGYIPQLNMQELEAQNPPVAMRHQKLTQPNYPQHLNIAMKLWEILGILLKHAIRLGEWLKNHILPLQDKEYANMVFGNLETWEIESIESSNLRNLELAMQKKWVSYSQRYMGVNHIPKSHKTIMCKWIFCTKNDGNSVVRCFKARLVAHGRCGLWQNICIYGQIQHH